MTKINEQELPSSVIDLLKWKNTKLKREANEKSWPDSVEKKNISEICLLWDKTEDLHLTDTLYSFLSIYAIGVWIYNQEKCLAIKPDMKKIYIEIPRVCADKKGKGSTSKSRVLCAKQLLLDLQNPDGKSKEYKIEVDELNEKIQPFIEVYFDLGNTTPIWPGGNGDRGNQNLGYMDMPELYFHEYKSWYEILCKTFPQAHLEVLSVDEPKYTSLYSFLSSIKTVDDYLNFIEYIVGVINVRSSKMEEELKRRM